MHVTAAAHSPARTTKVDRSDLCLGISLRILLHWLKSFEIAAIGVAYPISVYVDTFGTGAEDEQRIERAVIESIDLRPGAIIRDFDLRRPIYRNLAAYGHMGREELGLKYEERDLAAKILSRL